MTYLPAPSHLFICAANVGRSQIAEGVFNHLYGEGSSISCAGSEARKEKYNGRPLPGIIDFVREQEGIDISRHTIKYLGDIPDTILENITQVYFLYDPVIIHSCDQECQKQGLSPYAFLKERNMPINMVPISDPFDTGISGYREIILQIRNLVESIDS